MKAQVWILYFFLLIFIILVDLYVLRGISQLTQNMGSRAAAWIRTAYYALSIAGIIVLTWLFISREKYSYEEFFRHITAFMGFFILFYVPKLLFFVSLVLKDLVDLGFRAWHFFQPGVSSNPGIGEPISRTDFILKTGLLLSLIPFLGILHGIFRGKYNIKVKRLTLAFPDLPPAFEGMKFVQISDLHLGSFGGDTSIVSRAVEMINELRPDYLFFTGDLVNNRALEATPFIEVLTKMKARVGKYSVLGNHDYGVHFHWTDNGEYQDNMEKLYQYHADAGFRLLRNESVSLEKDGQKIMLAGVENWGMPPFPQFGDLEKALEGIGKDDFTILLSHDPSHWDAQVLGKTMVDLTLSGHTHGFQFAINIPGWKWSPVKMKYPRWSGLYKEGLQYLYVNIGLGYLAFPGRVGTPPEITEFTLKRS